MLRIRSTRALPLLAASLLAASFIQPPSRQYITLNWSAERMREARIALNTLPDVPWNCMCVDIAAENIDVILPNDVSGDAERARELLQMLKGVVSEGLLQTGGQIGTWRDDGTLAGVELRWSGGSNPFAEPAESVHLNTIGELRDPLGQELGILYCYNGAQMSARTASIEAEMGAPLTMHKVWLGQTLLSSDGGLHSLEIAGMENLIYGDMFSNGDFKVTGDGHSGTDQVRHLGTSNLAGDGHEFLDLAQVTSGVPLPGLPRSPASYAALATQAGNMFIGDLFLTSDGASGIITHDGTPVTPIVYATGRIYLEGNGMSGALTLVSERGIRISGAQKDLKPAIDDVLAIVIGGVVPEERLDNNILFEGRMGSAEGSLWAPGGVIVVVGTDNNLTGRMVAEKIRIAGYGNTVSDGSQ